MKHAKTKAKKILLSSAKDAMAWAYDVFTQWDFKEPIYIIWQLKKSTRNMQQNAMYWAWLKEAGDHLGHTDDEMHDYFKALFLVRIYAKDDVEGFGRMLQLVDDVKKHGLKTEYTKMILGIASQISTTDASEAQFAEYLTSIQRFMQSKHDFLFKDTKYN